MLGASRGLRPLSTPHLYDNTFRCSLSRGQCISPSVHIPRRAAVAEIPLLSAHYGVSLLFASRSMLTTSRDSHPAACTSFQSSATRFCWHDLGWRPCQPRRASSFAVRCQRWAIIPLVVLMRSTGGRIHVPFRILPAISYPVPLDKLSGSLTQDRHSPPG